MSDERRDSATSRVSICEQLSNAVLEAAGSSKRASLKQRLSSFTLAQLRLVDMKLHGREDDMALLKDKLSNIANTNDVNAREIILVAGVSGVGKSALVTKGLKQPSIKKGIAFVGGKFDQNQNHLPFSAFAEALIALAKHVCTKENTEKIKLDVQLALGEDDMVVIASAMPGCEDFYPADDNLTQRILRAQSSRHSLGGSSENGKEAVSRLKYAIRRLMKAVCSNLKSGVVMFIDDLQWSDHSSLDLLQSLLQDEEIPSLLLVGAYRDDEVAESHPLALNILEAERLGSTITTIKLGNLQRPAVQALVAEALNMEDRVEEIESLATIVHKKTKVRWALFLCASNILCLLTFVYFHRGLLFLSFFF